MGGVDLSCYDAACFCGCGVPARVGGVDLSDEINIRIEGMCGPRPCGRGGFKLMKDVAEFAGVTSPPVWAGWI